MGLFDSIFGGGSKDTTTTTTVKLPKWQEDAYKSITSEATRLYQGSPTVTGWELDSKGVAKPIYGTGTEGGKLNYYSGGVVPLSQGQTQGIQNAYGLGNSSPLNNSLLQTGNEYLSNLMANPYSVSSIANITAPTAYTPTEYTPVDISAPENYRAALAAAPTLNGSGNTVTAPTLGNTPRISTKDIEAAIIKADYGKAWNEINPYVEQLAKNASDPVYEKYIEEILPSLRSAAVAAGRYGGGITEMKEAQAAQDMESEMLAARGNIYGTAWENAAGREATRASQQASLQQSAALANQQARLAASTGNAELAQQKAIEAAKLQMQAQSLNQSTQTQYDLTEYGGGLQTALANQSALNDAAKTGYAGQLSAALANQQAGVTSGVAAARNRLDAGLANNQALLDASRFNQSTDLQTEAQRIQARGLNQDLANTALNQGLSQGTAGYNAQWTNAKNLYDFGNLDRAYQQAVADEAAAKANFEQMEPYQRLQLRAGLVPGNQGSTQTTNGQVYGASPLSQLAGLGLAGAGIYNLLGLGGAAATGGIWV